VWIDHGYWAGRYSNWRIERRLEQVYPQNFANFRNRLRAFRPRGELALQGKPACETFWNDVDGVRVEWRDAAGADMLLLNFGCDPNAKHDMAEALRSAPDLLGIASLKMPWGQWAASSSG
jgi:hypothetical protein